MSTLALHFEKDHPFLEIDDQLWFMDTGSPVSFGVGSEVRFGNDPIHVAGGAMGLDAQEISRLIGVKCRGLLGMDVLGRFDWILDVPGRVAEVSEEELGCDGTPVELGSFMKIPTLGCEIAGRTRKMFFDTGAPVSYLQDDAARTAFPAAGRVTDFYPGMGTFATDLHLVPIGIAGVEVTVRCGALPGLLGATLAMANADGILGNSIFTDRVVGFFPRRGQLVM